MSSCGRWEAACTSHWMVGPLFLAFLGQNLYLFLSGQVKFPCAVDKVTSCWLNKPPLTNNLPVESHKTCNNVACTVGQAHHSFLGRSRQLSPAEEHCHSSQRRIHKPICVTATEECEAGWGPIYGLACPMCSVGASYFKENREA